MTYASGGLIQASDFNTFNGGSVANVSGQINTVWSTGTGNAGYGQTAGSNVSVSGTINASDWTTLFNNLNAARKHQLAGSYSNLTVPASGGTITYNSSLSTQLTNAYTDRLTAATTGSTSTGTNDTWNPSVGATTALDTFRDCNIVFGSSDQARYFFNAGGRIAMIYSAVDNSGANARSVNMRDMVNQVGGFNTYRGYSNSGRTGAGGSFSVNNTGVGYYNTTSSVVTFIQNDDTVAPYNLSYVRVQHFYIGLTTNGANGNQVTFRLYLYSPADDSYGGSINITVTSRCDITFPSTTYLSDSWGTPTISYNSV